jgi:hypothetical protein
MVVWGIKYVVDAARPVGLVRAVTPVRHADVVVDAYDTVTAPAVMAALWLYMNE